MSSLQSRRKGCCWLSDCQHPDPSLGMGGEVKEVQFGERPIEELGPGKLGAGEQTLGVFPPAGSLKA